MEYHGSFVVETCIVTHQATLPYKGKQLFYAVIFNAFKRFCVDNHLIKEEKNPLCGSAALRRNSARFKVNNLYL